MENTYIILYAGIIIVALIYALRKDLKYDKRRNWLYNMGLMETFNYIKRY